MFVVAAARSASVLPCGARLHRDAHHRPVGRHAEEHSATTSPDSLGPAHSRDLPTESAAHFGKRPHADLVSPRHVGFKGNLLAVG